jgi:DNA-binding FadR family transcriptional regulator
MESYDLEPKYSSNEISGKCLKCLTEQELNSCLMQMLREDGINPDVLHKYEALVDFLKSPESEQLRIESERHLAEGKQVSVRITVKKGKPKYELIIREKELINHENRSNI